MVTIRHATSADRQVIEVFYEAVGYGAALGENDTLICAEAMGELIGVVRLALEHGVIVLRGMQVASEWRRKGVGARMLDEVQRTLRNRECYCVPYAHLVDFYSRAGFQIAPAAECPSFLVERVEGYRQTRREAFELMHRHGDVHGASA